MDILDKLNELLKNSTNAEKLNDALKSAKEEMAAVDRALGGLSSSSGIAGAKTQELIERKKQLYDIVGKLSDKIKDVSDKIKDVSDVSANVWNKQLKATAETKAEMGGLIDKIKEIGKGLTENIGSAIQSNAGLFLVHKFAFVRDVVNPGKDFTRFSQGMFKGMNEGLRNMLDVQNVARTHFMMMGQSIESANRQAEAFPNIMRQSALAMGLTRQELKQYQESVKLVPGAFDLASSSLLKMMGLQDQQIQLSALAATAVKAWSMTTVEGANLENRAYTQLGRTREEYVHMLGEIHGAVRSGVIPQKEAVEQIMNANQGLGVFGEKAGLATSVWRTFAESLRAGGVIASQVGDITKKVTDSIAGMSIQNRAFIGMMSGMFQGATALGGGLRMELAMRGPGGLEQNLEALTTSLAKFGGGRVITLEQAANNPQLEMQFVLQRQMLGKLTNITDTEQQNRILETLQGVQRGGISRIEGSRNLSDLMKRGGNIQQNMLTAIERIEQVASNNMLSFFNTATKGSAAQLALLNRIGVGLGAIAPDKTAIGRARQAGTLYARGREGRAKKEEETASEMLFRDLKKFFRMPEREQATRAMSSRIRPIQFGDIPNTFVGGLAGLGSRSRSMEMQQTMRPPSRQTAALMPHVAAALSTEPQLRMTMPERQLEQVRRPQQSVNQQLVQAIESLNSTMVMMGGVQSPAVMENIMRTETGATAGATAGTPAERPTAGAVSRSESTITVKVESDNDKLREFVENIIEKNLNEEVPKFINGERP